MRETRETIRRDERDELATALPAYEIGAVLGRGSFAVVYAARHRRLEREVAIKRLSPVLLVEGDARERFAAEARLLAALDHPHIVRVHDFVEDEDVCAFVMERLHGGTLADRLARGPVAHEWAIAVMLGALHGLEHAHRQGVLHRDIKPENLLFGDASQVKVADFGIAKVVGAGGARLTATAAALGTPAYMAPEQVTRSAGPLSSATDVWAAGSVLYEMLARQPPFPLTGELGDVLFRRLTDDPQPLAETAPTVAPEVAEAVMRALRRDPAERYATPGAFAAALEPAAERTLTTEGLAATGVVIHRTTVTERPALIEHETLPAPPAAPRQRRRRLLGAVAGVALAAAAAVAVVVLSAGGSATGTLPAAPVGWPAKVTSGFIDQVKGPAGVAQRLGRGGTTFAVFGGDAAAKTDWSHDPAAAGPAHFVRTAHRLGMFPYLSFYSLRSLGQSHKGDDASAPELRQILSDRRLMGIYWRNVKLFLQKVGSTRQTAAISLDSNFWSYLEKQLVPSGASPASLSAWVGGSGLAELKGIEDNLQGIAPGWRLLRDRYAPKAVLGYEFDDYASDVLDISRSENPPEQTVVQGARQAGQFYETVAGGDLDFAALTINGLAEAGQSPSPTNVYSSVEKDAVVTYVREFSARAHVRVVLEGVPLGNTVSKAITDKPYHWHDDWVQWLVGDDRFSGLRKLRDAGVIGVMFGVGSGPDETCPCDAAKDGITNNGKYATPSTSSDDDGGYFAARMAALGKAGGLSLG